MASLAAHCRVPLRHVSTPGHPVVELIVPNPKLKLMDQTREVLRLRHYSIRTERCYCDWIRRYIHFHRMQSRDDLELSRDSSRGISR